MGCKESEHVKENKLIFSKRLRKVRKGGGSAHFDVSENLNVESLTQEE